MKRVIFHWLRRTGLLRGNVEVIRSSTMPTDLEVPDSTLVIVHDGGLDKWACLRCPGGCRQVIPLSLNPNQLPRWSVSVDFWDRPSVRPSVHMTNTCSCHFWVTKGEIQWCKRADRSTINCSVDFWA
ncbi:MAG: DUF6527 family protein [Pseudomonadota bacterium]